MKVKNESEVAQSCPTLCDPMDCSLPGFSIHGIFQARVLEIVAGCYIEKFPFLQYPFLQVRGAVLLTASPSQLLSKLRYSGPFLGDRGVLKEWLWPEKYPLNFLSNWTASFLPTFLPFLTFSFTAGQTYIVDWHLFPPYLTSSSFSFTEISSDKFSVHFILVSVPWRTSINAYMHILGPKSCGDKRAPDMFGDMRVEELVFTSMGKAHESTSSHRIPPSCRQHDSA